MLGRLVTIAELAPILQATGGLWETSSRRWLMGAPRHRPGDQGATCQGRPAVQGMSCIDQPMPERSETPLLRRDHVL
jgi:hypothetical protein